MSAPEQRARCLAQDYANLFVAHPREELTGFQQEIADHFLAGFRSRDAEVKVLVYGLKTVQNHCLCTRNTKGFDYGEKHKKLGKPNAGARWLVPKDIVNQCFYEWGKRRTND